jgi:Flp pilus assembly protein TadG
MSINKRSSGRGKRRGATLVLIVLLLTVLVGMVAFAIDVGRMYLVRSQLQTAVDSGALAAGLKLRKNPKDIAGAVAAAKQFVQHNRVGWLVTVPEDSITIETGKWDKYTRTFTVSTVNPEVVRVQAHHDNEPLAFAGVLGHTTFGVPRTAIASTGGARMDIMMVLDLSGSMGSQGRIQALRAAAPVFVDVIAEVGDDDRIGMMGYGALNGAYDPATRGHNGVPYREAPSSLYPADSDWIGVLESPLTYDLTGLKTNVLDSGTLIANKYNGWTPIGAAIRDSSHYLNLNARADAKKALVLMSDGHANKPSGNGPGYARTMAGYANSLDIKIYTISLGNGADEQLMEDIAGITGAEHFDATGSGQISLTDKLKAAFRNAAGAMKGTQLVQ